MILRFLIGCWQMQAVDKSVLTFKRKHSQQPLSLWIMRASDSDAVQPADILSHVRKGMESIADYFPCTNYEFRVLRFPACHVP